MKEDILLTVLLCAEKTDGQANRRDLRFFGNSWGNLNFDKIEILRFAQNDKLMSP